MTSSGEGDSPLSTITSRTDGPMRDSVPPSLPVVGKSTSSSFRVVSAQADRLALTTTTDESCSPI